MLKPLTKVSGFFVGSFTTFDPSKTHIPMLPKNPIKLSLFVLVIAILVTACGKKAEETTVAAAPTLTLKWTTDTLLTTCESVIYDKANDVLYVSNINGDPSTKDGNGSIAKVGLDGKIIDAQWVKGMDAPKGLGLFNGKLYASDIDRIVEIDVASGKISSTYAVDSAKFLNDVAVDATGRVFVSDSNKKNVILLENGKTSIWIENLSAGPNGLFSEEKTMLMALWDSKTLHSIDLASKQLTLLVDSLENPDGIEAVGDGGYLVSSWNGLVHYVGTDGKVTRLLDTTADKIGAADIEYIAEKNLLLVPTFFKNTVSAYELKK
jgi:sugar lactone lactonase YvrE